MESENLDQFSSATCSCVGEGITITTEDRFILANACANCATSWEEKESRGRYADILSYGQIPCGFLAAKDPTEIPTFVEEWYSACTSQKVGTNQSVFLCGPSGSGKTFSAIALLFRFAKLGQTIRYIDCTEYLMDRRASYSAKHIDNIGDTYTKKNEKDRWSIARYDVVILDNIGVGTSNDWTKEQYDHLINSRQTSGKITIYISNFADDAKFTTDGKKLSNLVGPRAASRVNQASMLFLKERTLTSTLSPAVIFEPVKPPRPLSPNETTFLHIWAREGLFSMVSKKERSTLTMKSKINPSEVIERPFSTPREYISWSGFHVVMQGPVVDYDDANVLAALMKIYHRIGSAGSVATTLADICRELGFDPNSGAKKAQLKRSLIRLAESRITIRTIQQDAKVKSDDLMWIGGFLDSVAYEGSTKNRKIIVRFNESLAPFYQKKSLVLLPLDILTSLSPYAQGIYRFLLGHRDDYKFIGLNRWRDILAINAHVQEKSFKDCMRLALRELVTRNLLSAESNIDPNGIVHSYLNRERSEQVH